MESLNNISKEINFHTSNTEILKLCENGDIFVKGKLIGNDKEVLEDIRLFSLEQGLIKNK